MKQLLQSLEKLKMRPQGNLPTPPSAVKRVVIISLDGGKPAVMRVSRMPHLEGMQKHSAFTMKAQAVIPSVTLVNHTSMLTGVKPAKHKILWNEWEPQKGMVTVPTIFSLAKKFNRKLRTGLFAAKQKFTHLFLPGSLDNYVVIGDNAPAVATAVADTIRRNTPDLLFVHFADADSTGHSFGWGSPQQKMAFADCDKGIEIIVSALRRQGLMDETVILISADHGGHEKTHGMDVTDDREIPWIAYGAGVKAGTKLGQPNTCDTAATALWLMGMLIPADFDGRPVTEAFTR